MKPARFASLFAASAVAGFAVVQVAGRAAGHRTAGSGYPILWPVERAFSGGSGVAVVVAFLAIGAVAGWLHPKRAATLGLATVALFPVAIAVELALDSTSHNLFPFELVIDVIMSIPAVIGAVVAAAVARKREIPFAEFPQEGARR